MQRKSHEKNQEEDERICAEGFLRWSESYQRKPFVLKRVEKRSYHELKDWLCEQQLLCLNDRFPNDGFVRWDFVAYEPGEPGWIAIEHKELINSSPPKGMSFWRDIFSSVEQELQGQLHGSYYVLCPPPLSLNSKQKSALVESIALLLAQRASTSNGEEMDLGPDMLATFPTWPSDSDVQTEPKISEVKKARPLSIRKRSSLDSLTINVAIGPVEAFEVDNTTDLALKALFDKTGRFKAAEQLGQAKNLGAEKAILLLDLQNISWNDNRIYENLLRVDPYFMNPVDEIFLANVKPKAHRVRKVWSIETTWLTWISLNYG